MAVIDLLLTAATVVLLIPCLVLLVECAAAWPPRRSAVPIEGHPRIAVLVPAHDEEAAIGATVRALGAQLGPGDRLLVIADNCGDRTAEAAREAGALVAERVDPGRRGKGFALAFGLDRLAEDPPEVVVIVDADCRVSAGGLGALARLAAGTGRPVQAEYLLAAPPDGGALSAVSALAILVRNAVRPLGLARLGLPCQLTGSGMAFPWGVIRGAPNLGSELVEDLVVGLELALDGHAPLFCAEVQVRSELPEGRAAAGRQRRRWEHGQLAVLARYGPRLLAAGIRGGRADLLALALDLMVPPLALLVAVLVLAAGAGLAAGLLGGIWRPLAVVLTAMAAVGFAALGSWAARGRATIPLRHLFFAPLYVLWKLPIYASLLLRGPQRTWERTTRRGEEPSSEDPGQGPRSSR